MSAKYFCDKCGREVEEHEYYAISFRNNANWERIMRYYFNKDIYLCEKHREAVIILIKAALGEALRHEAVVMFKEVKTEG